MIILFYSIIFQLLSFSAPKSSLQTDGLYDVKGKWNVEMTYFINNGKKGEGSEPLITTTWMFGENGVYKATTNFDMKGTYTQDGKTLKVNALGLETDYIILEMDKNSMTLQSAIIETESLSMLTVTEFTRVK